MALCDKCGANLALVGRAHRCVAVNMAPAVNTAVNATPPPAVTKAERDAYPGTDERRALRAPCPVHNAQLYQEAPATGKAKSQDDIWDHNCPLEMPSGSPGATQEWPHGWQESGTLEPLALAGGLR